TASATSSRGKTVVHNLCIFNNLRIVKQLCNSNESLIMNL
ncbi:hypothetical protein LINPERHAP1_LOCUS13335, partial [Linum perenne]